MAYATVTYLLLLAFLLFPLAAIAQNVSLGSSLATSDVTPFWPSPSGEFAFGFQRIGNDGSGSLLAIWFNKIQEQTIVWSANRNNLAPDGSRIQLNRDGKLVLTNPSGLEIWSRAESASYGAMLDTGNFVLATNGSATLWQSFDEPTDTILPGQVFNQGNQLVSSFSDTNLSSGRFMFRLRSDGNLLLCALNNLFQATEDPYWETKTVDSGYQVIFNQSGSIFLRAKNGTLLNSISSDALSSTSQSYQRAILEYDGVFRQYVYPKSTGSSMVWSTLRSIPSDNFCLSLSQETGRGACGFNSLCSMGDDQRTRCDCPLGYVLNNPNDKLGGCRQDFLDQDCNDESREVEAFTLQEVLNANWFGGDYEVYRNVTEDWCRRNCLDDCYCAIAVYSSRRNCWKKRYPFSNGRVDPTTKSLIKVRKDNSTTIRSGEKRKRINQSVLIVSGSVLLSSLLVFLLLLALCYLVKSKGKKQKKLIQYPAVPGVNIRSFSYSELEEATNGFSEELGDGGFSTVYKGVLNDENGKVVAVKKLHKMVREGDEEFKAEVNSIGRTNHKNLVQLLGFCNEGQHRLLVYEYMEMGSIADLLFKDSRLSWSQRVQVAIDTARGLFYLHEECSTQVIHCDIKPQNVLLDETLTAKIADFGIAKLLRKDQTRTTTKIRGTRGYVAPEWFKSMPITVKVDVYSFGVLLLELICCRKHFAQDAEKEDEMILVEWACDCCRRNELHLLVADDEEAKEDIKRFEKFLVVAICCIQENPSLRPSMKNVMLMLEGSVEVSTPPDLSSFIGSVISA